MGKVPELETDLGITVGTPACDGSFQVSGLQLGGQQTKAKLWVFLFEGFR